MTTGGPIIIVDDDPNEHLFIKSAIEDFKYNNSVISFQKAKEALKYLQTTKDSPFLVLCDVHMPEMDGLGKLL